MDGIVAGGVKIFNYALCDDCADDCDADEGGGLASEGDFNARGGFPFDLRDPIPLSHLSGGQCDAMKRKLKCTVSSSAGGERMTLPHFWPSDGLMRSGASTRRRRRRKRQADVEWVFSCRPPGNDFSFSCGN